jgi:hypothetical protein
MTLISATVLASLKTLVESAMPDTAVVRRTQATINGLLWQPFRDEHYDGGPIDFSEGRFRFDCAIGTDVRLGDILVINSRAFRVLWLPQLSQYDVNISIRMDEVQ